MITKYANNPIVTPADVKPSMEGYKVLGALRRHRAQAYSWARTSEQHLELYEEVRALR